MKLICPHCGLKGTADDSLFEKKIRCPECRKTFRLSEDISVTSPQHEPEPQGEPEAATDVSEQAVDSAVSVESAGAEPEEQLQVNTDPEVSQCSVCGFALSHTYLTEIDSKLFCRICRPA